MVAVCKLQEFRSLRILAERFVCFCRENRMRLTIEIAQITLDNWPKDKPVFCRLSATDWYKEGEKDSSGNYVSWGLEQSKILMERLVKMGISFFDITSGGLEYDQAVWPSPGYNSPLAAQLRKSFPDVPMGTVGLIKTPEQGASICHEDIIQPC